MKLTFVNSRISVKDVEPGHWVIFDDLVMRVSSKTWNRGPRWYEVRLDGRDEELFWYPSHHVTQVEAVAVLS